MKDKLLLNKEKQILKKFVHLNVISEEDEKILNKYASIGFVRFDFNWDKMKQIAILTDSGLKHLDR